MRILGLDVGEKRIGVAKVDSGTKIAVPIGFIRVDGTEWQEINRIANLNNTKFFVLGLPRNNSGTETAQSLYVRKFARTLAKKIPGAKIRLQDETLTSVVAEERLKERNRKYQKGDIDAEAASIILQDFIENFKETTLKTEEKTNPTNEETEEVKKKTKRTTKWICGAVALTVLIAVAVGGIWLVKEKRDRDRAEYYAAQEAAMQPEVFNFTIRPGETLYDIKENLIEVGYSEAEIEEAFGANYDFEFLNARPQGASLEGYLYGETHEFYKTATVKEILEVFLTEMERIIIENDLEARYAARELSLYEGITLASIVQKEAPTAEQPTVAQVFLSRLAYGVPLGSDVTVSYALDMIDPERRIYSDNQNALTVDSCYNTRLHSGLPCGPISNPGLSALLAVAEPSDTSYLYFLTGDDGLMYYSYTEAEHIQNIYSHCQELCNIAL